MLFLRKNSPFSFYLLLFCFLSFSFESQGQIATGTELTIDFTGINEPFEFSDVILTFTEGGNTYKMKIDILSTGLLSIQDASSKTGADGVEATFSSGTIITFDINNDGTFGGTDDAFSVVSMNVGSNSIDPGTRTATVAPDGNNSKAFSITSNSSIIREFDLDNPSSFVSGSFTEADYTGIQSMVMTVSSFSVQLDNLVIVAGSPAPSAVAPTVTTAGAASISATSATLGGTVTADGGASITERGIVWSTSDTEPEIGDASVNQDAEGGTSVAAFSEAIGSFPANTTIYYNAYATNSEGTSYGTASSFTTSQANFSLTVMLQGPFQNGTMNTTLRTNNALPADQPYSNPSAENASNIPATAVDWIEVEIRTGTAAATRVGSRAAFVLSNGSVVDKDGATLTLSFADGSDYYIVIHHRNHLSVMSAAPVSISSSSYTYNFTTGQGQAFGTSPLTEVSTGVFAVPSGDANGDGDVDITDLTNWRSQNGNQFIYSSTKADFNLDGVINAVDRNLHWKTSNDNNKSSQVPGG